MGIRLAVLAAALYTAQAFAVIYGHDDRQDILHVPWLRPQAMAVAAAVPNLFIEKNQDGTLRIGDLQSAAQSGASFMCKDERFSEQPTIGMCTGFLIGDRYLVTAGHCMIPTGIVTDEFHPFCEAFSWYFDYNLKHAGDFPGRSIPADRVYGCKRVIRAENIDGGLIPGNDFALIELDRPVTADIHPLTIATREVSKGDLVYTLGHPTGLPAKFSGLSPVLKLDQPHYFSVNLDTQGGNSGGPVFNSRNEVLGILVSGYSLDFIPGPGGCNALNRCDQDGGNCLETSQLQRSNYVQKISAVLPYLPKENVSIEIEAF